MVHWLKIADLKKYVFNTIPIKIQVALLQIQSNNNNKSSICMELQNTLNSKSISGGKNKTKGITCFDFKLYQIYNNENSMVLAEKQTHKTMEQNWQPTNKPTNIWATNFQQRSQKHTVEKGKPLQQCCENWKITCKRIKLDCYLTPYTKINSKCIEDFNMRSNKIHKRMHCHQSYQPLSQRAVLWTWLETQGI